MAILGDVRVGSVEKAVQSQVAQFKQNVSDMVKRVLRACWRRIRQRMIKERLTGRRYVWWGNSSPKGYGGQKPPKGAPLAKRSGNLIASMGGFVTPDGDGWKLDAQIGRGAYYADQHETAGRLQFRRIAQEEMAKARDEIKQHYAVLTQLGGARGLSAGSQALLDAAETTLSSEAAGFRREFAERRARSNQLQRARRAKTSGQRAFKNATRGFGGLGIPTSSSSLSDPPLSQSIAFHVGEP